MNRVWLAIRRRLGRGPFPSAVWDDEPFDDFDQYPNSDEQKNSANEAMAGKVRAIPRIGRCRACDTPAVDYDRTPTGWRCPNFGDGRVHAYIGYGQPSDGVS